MKANVTISLPVQVAERIEAVRGSQSRSSFITGILEGTLNKQVTQPNGGSA